MEIFAFGNARAHSLHDFQKVAGRNDSLEMMRDKNRFFEGLFSIRNHLKHDLRVDVGKLSVSG